MESTVKKQRDLYIDAAKGLCIIGIIFIHTVFYSGSDYVPGIIRNLSLFLDVPAFFFLTGCTLSIHKSLNPIKQMTKLIIIFASIYLFFMLLFGPYSLDIIYPLFLQTGTINLLPVIGGSYWFVPVYVVSLIYADMIIKYLNKNISSLLLIIIPVYYLVLWVNNITMDNKMLGCKIQMVLFYLWLILLGYKLYNKPQNKIYRISFVIASIIGLLFLKMNHIDLFLQNYKFPVMQLPYILASLLSIGLILILKREIKENFLTGIGQKAIFFYASQGISSSIIYLLKDIPLNIYLKLPLCFITNCILAYIIGIGLYKLFGKFGNLLLKEEQKFF
ncbi:hypothetical protein IKQ26_05645 [bacterium]|nr:hypothetical protein [bacterium]